MSMAVSRPGGGVWCNAYHGKCQENLGYMENKAENLGYECFKMFQVPADTTIDPTTSDWISKNDYMQQVFDCEPLESGVTG